VRAWNGHSILWPRHISFKWDTARTAGDSTSAPTLVAGAQKGVTADHSFVWRTAASHSSPFAIDTCWTRCLAASRWLPPELPHVTISQKSHPATGPTVVGKSTSWREPTATEYGGNAYTTTSTRTSRNASHPGPTRTSAAAITNTTAGSARVPVVAVHIFPSLAATHFTGGFE
jgi:hypothetical protein